MIQNFVTRDVCFNALYAVTVERLLLICIVIVLDLFGSLNWPSDEGLYIYELLAIYIISIPI